MKRTGILYFGLALLCLTIICLPTKSANAAVRKPRLNLTELNLVHKNTYTLRVYNLKKSQTLSFKTSNNKIASLTSRNSKGRSVVVKGRKPGIASVTISIKQKGRVVQTLTCRVNVSPPAMSIVFRENNIRLYVGDSFKAKPIIKPNITSEIPMFTCSDSSLISLNLRGKVTALAPGRVYVYATLSSGQRAYYVIDIINRPPDQNQPRPTNHEAHKMENETI